MHVLIVSNGFAPWGGPVGMRSTKLASWGLAKGDQISVLTTAADCRHAFDDPDLLETVQDADILRVSDGTNYSLRPMVEKIAGYKGLRIADRLLGLSRKQWAARCINNAKANWTADRLPDVVYATPPTPEVVDIARQLALTWQRPFVMDFRDPPWEIGMDDIDFQTALSDCALASFNTPPAAKRIASENPEYASKIECRTNGVEPPSSQLDPLPDGIRRHILFAGGIYDWVADAVCQLAESTREANVGVDVYGFLEPKRQKEIDQIRRSRAEFHPPVPSSQVLKLMRTAWANLVTLPPDFQISSKVYLTIASGRPVLVYGKSQAASSLLDTVPGIFYFDQQMTQKEFSHLAHDIDAYDEFENWKARFEWLKHRSWPAIYDGLFERFRAN